MEKNTFKITISGTKADATIKANALALLATNLSTGTLHALAHIVKTDPQKVAFAKQFLGIKE